MVDEEGNGGGGVMCNRGLERNKESVVEGWWVRRV